MESLITWAIFVLDMLSPNKANDLADQVDEVALPAG
jgi:hypothetical protein